MIALSGKAVWRVRKVERAIPAIDKGIGGVEPFTFVCVGKKCGFFLGIKRLQAPAIALRVTRYCKAAAAIQGHAVRARLGSREGHRAFIAARPHKDAETVAGHPFPDAVDRDFSKKKISGMNPNRALGPLETCIRDRALDFRISRHNVVDFRTQFLNSSEPLRKCQSGDVRNWNREIDSADFHAVILQLPVAKSQMRSERSVVSTLIVRCN